MTEDYPMGHNMSRTFDGAEQHIPDLLEALRGYLSASPQCKCTDPACPMESARIKARAAIARVEGK